MFDLCFRALYAPHKRAKPAPFSRRRRGLPGIRFRIVSKTCEPALVKSRPACYFQPVIRRSAGTAPAHRADIRSSTSRRFLQVHIQGEISMANVKAQLKLLYAVELIGKGTYVVYAQAVQSSRPDFAKLLNEYGDHELRHAGMAKTALKKHFGVEVDRDNFWIGFGKCLAYLQFLVPMFIKLWCLQWIEKIAIIKLNGDIAAVKGESNPYVDILKQLPPDESRHAAVYDDWKKK
jgi:hypothetical protein